MVKTCGLLFLCLTSLVTADTSSTIYTKVAVTDTVTAAPAPQPLKAVNSPREASMITTLLPSIRSVNATVGDERSQLLKLHQQFLSHAVLSQTDQNWLYDLADKYHVSNPDFDNDTTWKQLLERVDIIPPSMVLAQAANESAWGHSRFAQNGNNYFGQFCYSRGCGIVPKNAYMGGKRHELKSFPSVHQAVASYVHNLNTNPAYHELRALRSAARQQGEPVKGVVLATGLTRYSSNGSEYVHIIRNLIHNYNLDEWDNTETM